MTKYAIVVLCAMLISSAHAGSFYCADGKQMKCLGFGEKIVDSKAICFDPMRCSQEGFVCKSELNAMSDEHENLLREHNELVNTHNELIGTYEITASQYEGLQRCISASMTLDEAKSCL